MRVSFVPAPTTRDGSFGGVFLGSLRGLKVTQHPVPVEFQYGSVELTPKGQSAAAFLLEFINRNESRTVVLTGHADRKGDEKFNCELSRKRLDALVAVLKPKLREGTELEGRWFSNFNWVRWNRAPFDRLTFSKILGFESAAVAPKLVLGDFNEWMRGLATALLTEKLNSVDLRNYLRRRRTYPGLFPVLHLDHIYYAGRVEVVRIELPRTRLSLVASDHLPLVADVRIG